MKQSTKQVILGLVVIIIYTTFGLRIKDRLGKDEEKAIAIRAIGFESEQHAKASFDLHLDYPKLFTESASLKTNPRKEVLIEKTDRSKQKKVIKQVSFPMIKGIVQVDTKSASVYIEDTGLSLRKSIGDTVGIGFTISQIHKNSLRLLSLPGYNEVDTLLYVGQGNLQREKKGNSVVIRK